MVACWYTRHVRKVSTVLEKSIQNIFKTHIFTWKSISKIIVLPSCHHCSNISHRETNLVILYSYKDEDRHCPTPFVASLSLPNQLPLISNFKLILCDSGSGKVRLGAIQQLWNYWVRVCFESQPARNVGTWCKATQGKHN